MKRRSFLKSVFAVPLLAAIGIKAKKPVWRGPGQTVPCKIVVTNEVGDIVMELKGAVPVDCGSIQRWVILQQQQSTTVKVS